MYGDLDRRGNAEDRIGRLRQTGLVATYISTFRELAAQIDWNKSSLIAQFRGGFKDEILDLVATIECQPWGLYDWMAMASRIDERLWGRRQNRQFQLDSFLPKASTSILQDLVSRTQSNHGTLEPVPMELGAIRVTTTLAKIAIERLEYQR